MAIKKDAGGLSICVKHERISKHNEKVLKVENRCLIRSENMDLILCVIIFFLINIGMLALIKWTKKHVGAYDTIFCRDVRASFGMFAYKSDLEETRKKLNHLDSKF